MKKILIITVMIFVSMFGFGQNTKNIDPTPANNKTSGMRMNNNVDKNNPTTKSALNRLTQANTANPALETYEKDAVFAGKDPKDEVIERRDRTSKHFRNADGSFTAIVSSGASLNYQDERGNWKTISRDIEPINSIAGYAYKNESNSFKTYFPTTADGNGVKTVLKEGEVHDFLNPKMLWLDAQGNVIPSNTVVAESKIHGALDTKKPNELIYENVFNNTDVQFIQTPDGRKLNYILNNSSAIANMPQDAVSIAYSEDIIFPKGWTVIANYDESNIENNNESIRTISIFDNDGQPIVTYMSPDAYDNEGRIGIDIYYKYTLTENILTVWTITPLSWLNSPNRIYPITIDPTGTYYSNGAITYSSGYITRNGTTYTKSTSYSINFGKAASNTNLLRGYCKFYLSDLYDIIGTNVTASVTDIRMKVNANYLGAAGMFAGRLTSQDPITSTAINLYNAIAYTTTATSGYYGVFMSTGLPAINNYYGGSLVGNTSANPISDLQANFTAAKKYLNIGFRANGDGTASGNNTYWTLYGAASPGKDPYLEIDYIGVATAPSCATLLSPANGATSHPPVEPLTWSVASGATSYDVYLGTSSNPSVVANVTTTYYSPTLADNTTYFWKIVPKNTAGEPTGCSIWEFKTGVAPVSGDYRSRNITLPDIDVWSDMYGGGTWQTYNGSSWVNTSTPPNSTTVNVLIRAGSKILIDDDFQCKNLTIEGLIQFDWRGAKNLTVNGDVIMFGNGDFQTSSTGDQYEDNTFQKLFHRLYVKGNIYNNTNADHGIMFCDLNTFGYDNFSSLVEVRFRGSGNSEWSGTGENDIGGLSIEKDNANNVVTIKPDQLLGWHSNNLDGNGFFMYDKIEHKGTLKIGGTYTLLTRFGINSDANAVHDARQLPRISSLSSGNNFTLIIDNPNFGITGFTSVECYGNLQITQGNMNVGSGSGNYIEFYNGSSLIIDGGTLTSTGSINYRGTGSFNLTLSAGKIRAGFFGNSLSNTRGWFDVRNNATVNISGGEIHLINSSASILSYPMYNMQAANVTITGGKLLIGSDASPNGTNTFTISGPTPSIELFTNGSIKSNAIMWGNVQCYGYLNIPLNCEFLTYQTTTPFIFSIIGNIDHKGKLYAEVENSKILFNGTSAQTFNSTGTYNGTTGISILEVNNSAGVLLTGSGTIVKNLLKTNGTFNIGSCYLNLYGNVTRTDGYLGGTASSMLNIYGTGNVGNLYFDPTLNKLKTLKLDRTSSGIINLATNLNVEESITFTNGLLYTYKDNTVANGSKTIFLAPTAELLSENINSYIYGKVSISNATFGNIGATMSSLSGLRNTSLTRITGTEGIQTVGDGLASIACYWDIQVQNQPSSALNTTFKWLSPFDNSLPTTDMQAYTLRTPNPWETVGNATTVTGDPRSITVDATHFSIWTVSKKSTPLPVELLSFAAECKGNSKEFTWETASEINSDYFEIMASANGKNFVAVAKIPAAGNSSQNRKYTHTLRDQNDKTYYRLKQTDFDGKFEYFNPISINCNSNLSLQINIYPNPAQKELYCSIVTDKAMDVEIQIVNYLGQICYVKNHSIVEGRNTLDISPPYNSGIYLVKVISNSTVIETKKIIIK